MKNFIVNDAQFINDVYDALYPKIDTDHEREWLVKRALYVSANYAYHGNLSNVTIQAVGSDPKITIIYDPHCGYEGTVLARIYGESKYKQFQPFDHGVIRRETPAGLRDRALKKAVTDFIERHEIPNGIKESEAYDDRIGKGGSYV